MEILQRLCVALATCCVIATQALAMGPFASADAKAAIGACAAARAPLLMREKQYSDLRRARLTETMAQTARTGAGIFMTGALASVTGGASLLARPGGVGGGAQGANTRGKNGQTAGGADNGAVTAASSLAAAFAGSTDAYIRSKQQQFDNDARRIAAAIDGDAAAQVGAARDTNAQVGALVDCGRNQMNGFKAQMSAAVADKDRKELEKQRPALQAALKADLELADEIVTQQATLVKTFTQSRAMAEGRSEADVLANDTPAYAAEVSHTPLALPAAAANTPPPMVTLRAMAVRSSPNASAGVIMNFPAGRSVTPKSRAAEDRSWWVLDIGGSPGFVRAADLGAPGETPAPAAGKIRDKGKAKGPPGLAPPANIRRFNHLVLTGRTSGVDQLKALSAEAHAG